MMKYLVVIGAFVLALVVIGASSQVMLYDSGIGVIDKSTGAIVSSADITIDIYDSMNGGNLIYTETFPGGIVNGNWNILLGENPSNRLYLDNGKAYYRDYTINGKNLDFVSYDGSVVGRQIFYSSLGTVPGGGKFLGKTSTLYTANLNYNNNGSSIYGYTAGNAICNSEYKGSHLCSQNEIIGSISYLDISNHSSWDGAAWISAGGAKYSPAQVPVNDCNGFKHGASGTFLGSFWIFNRDNGGVGGIGTCANNIPLACCG